jgi:hypothetical protein
MSLSSSPRIPHLAADSPRRRPKERKRQDLRSYYGIDGATHTAGAAQAQGSVALNPELDKDDFKLSEYVAKINQTPGPKDLLKLENELVRDIRILNGEHKALIYDNYGRILTISQTLKQMRLRLDAMSVSWGDFQAILESVRKWSSATSVPGETSAEEQEGQSDEADELMKAWLKDASTRIARLTAFEQYEAALEEVNEVEQVLAESGDALLRAQEAATLSKEVSEEKLQIQEMLKHRLVRQDQEAENEAPSVPAKD